MTDRAPMISKTTSLKVQLGAVVAGVVFVAGGTWAVSAQAFRIYSALDRIDDRLSRVSRDVVDIQDSLRSQYVQTREFRAFAESVSRALLAWMQVLKAKNPELDMPEPPDLLGR